MKDVYKIIKSTSMFPLWKFEVWVKGNITVSDNSYPCHQQDPGRTFVAVRCIHKTSTEQKAQEYIAYWEEVANFSRRE